MNWLNEREVLSSSVIGFEFEFFSNLNRNQIASAISTLCNVNVVPVNRYHSSVKIDETNWKIEPDLSGGIFMNELITGPIPYDQARIHLSKILNWIDINGWTDLKSAFQVNISFNPWKIRTINNITQIDKLKFVLNIDEEKVYEFFPNRKNSIYARSINSIIPSNKFIFNNDINRIIKENYTTPSSKYYGVNFSKIFQNYLEFRYMGGEDYQKKLTGILKTTDYFINFTHEILQNTGYNAADLDKLRLSLHSHKSSTIAFSSVDNFLLTYSDIKISVNLDSQIQTIKTYWSILRERLFDLIINGGMLTGWINYDTDVCKFQLKDCTLESTIDNFEIIDCIIKGNIIECDIYNSVIDDSHIIDCILYPNNKVVNSKIMRSAIYYENEITSCYIDNRLYQIDGSIKNSIIRSGVVLPSANIEDTEIIKNSNKTEFGKDLNLGEKK